MVVLLPHGLEADSPQVRTFVQAGLQKLQTSEVSETSEVSSEDLKALVADWSERVGVAVGPVQVRAMRRGSAAWRGGFCEVSEKVVSGSSGIQDRDDDS